MPYAILTFARTPAVLINLSAIPSGGQSNGMGTLLTPVKCNHRFPVKVVSHVMWLSFRFCLSFRDKKELLLERGVFFTYEGIRQWCCKVSQQYPSRPVVDIPDLVTRGIGVLRASSRRPNNGGQNDA